MSCSRESQPAVRRRLKIIHWSAVSAFELISVALSFVTGLALALVLASLAKFWQDLEANPWKVHEAIGVKFEARIKEQRRRTLGPQSEWARALQPLQEAADEADRSIAYWRQRLTTDGNNELATSQLSSAQSLAEKFRAALAELDGRQQALLRFFNECEARVAALQQGRRDYEESQRLASLSARVDEVVVDARQALALIGDQFVADAIRVGRALGGIERLAISDSASEVSIDRIELVADKILDSAEDERKVIDRLMSV